MSHKKPRLTYKITLYTTFNILCLANSFIFPVCGLYPLDKSLPAFLFLICLHWIWSKGSEKRKDFWVAQRATAKNKESTIPYSWSLVQASNSLVVVYEGAGLSDSGIWDIGRQKLLLPLPMWSCFRGVGMSWLLIKLFQWEPYVLRLILFWRLTLYVDILHLQSYFNFVAFHVPFCI